MKSTKTITIPITLCDYCGEEIDYKAHDVVGEKDYHVGCTEEMEKRKK